MGELYRLPAVEGPPHMVAAMNGSGVLKSFSVTSTPFDTIPLRSITWLEKPLWQQSAFQLLAGAKGAGKGTYVAGLAGRISREGGKVIIISSEDSAGIDVGPRLLAAKADMGRCRHIQQHIRLPEHIEGLRQHALDLDGVAMLVLDPIANHIGATNANNDAEVRDAIAPLNKLADELDCLIIGVRHPGKDRDRGALASVLGSTAWVDTPRAVVMIAADDEDSAVRVIQVVAGNRSLNGSAEAFRIDAVDVPGLTEPITLAVSLGESPKSVEDLIATPPREASKTEQAKALILVILEGEGEQESDTLDARVANETGLALQTVRNARVKLGQEGRLMNIPDRDEHGKVERWIVKSAAESEAKRSTG